LEHLGVEGRIILKWILKNDVGHGLDWSGSWQLQVAGSSEHVDDPLGSIKCGELFEWPRFLSEGSGPWSYSTFHKQIQPTLFLHSKKNNSSLTKTKSFASDISYAQVGRIGNFPTELFVVLLKLRLSDEPHSNSFQDGTKTNVFCSPPLAYPGGWFGGFNPPPQIIPKF
jgi:hypothetical protein